MTPAEAADFWLRTCKKIKAPQLACIARKALLGARSYLEPDAIRTIMMCGRGGTGRRATLRSLWPKGRGSSSLLDRTIQSCRTSKIGSDVEPPRKGAPCRGETPVSAIDVKHDLWVSLGRFFEQPFRRGGDRGQKKRPPEWNRRAPDEDFRPRTRKNSSGSQGAITPRGRVAIGRKRQIVP